MFRPNSSDDRWLHGPAGYAALTASVPAGARLIVIRADEVEVRNLEASVYLVDCKSARAEDVTGDVLLLGTPFEAARRIHGRLFQRWYSFGGMSWRDEEKRRSAAASTAPASRPWMARSTSMPGGRTSS